MYKHIFSLLILGFSLFSFADSSVPFEDNILFAFDKCQTVRVNLNLNQIKGELEKPFDIHCIQDSDKKQFKCDFFETESSKKADHEKLSGGRKGKVGYLSNLGGTNIKFSLEKGSASFDAPVSSSDGLNDGRKFCIGIFLFEKDALKKKK